MRQPLVRDTGRWGLDVCVLLQALIAQLALDALLARSPPGLATGGRDLDACVLSQTLTVQPVLDTLLARGPPAVPLDARIWISAFFSKPWQSIRPLNDTLLARSPPGRDAGPWTFAFFPQL